MIAAVRRVFVDILVADVVGTMMLVVLMLVLLLVVLVLVLVLAVAVVALVVVVEVEMELVVALVVVVLFLHRNGKSSRSDRLSTLLLFDHIMTLILLIMTSLCVRSLSVVAHKIIE